MTYDEVMEQFPMVARFLINAPEYIREYTTKEVPANHNVAEKDEPISYVSFICFGHLAVLNEFYSGSSYVLDYARAGDIIGLEALFADIHVASVTLRTLVPTTLFSIPRDLFKNWLESDPELLMKIAKYIGARHYAASYRSGREIIYPPKYFLANLFLQYAPLSGESGIIRLSRQQMADQTGLCVKTINRTIKKMCEGNMVTIEKGKVHLTNSQINGLRTMLKDSYFPSVLP